MTDEKQIEENAPIILLGYEIYLQDLSKPYMELEKIGYAKTISEAQSCVRLLREALLTANERKVSAGRNLSNCTILFRAVLKE